MRNTQIRYWRIATAVLLLVLLSLSAEAAEPYMVKDINTNTLDSSPKELTEVNGVLYFTVDDGTNGTELWRSDGTAAGTVMVKDIRTGADGSHPQNLTNVNGMLYFMADDETNGKELWRSDGTVAGTVLVKDIAAGAKGSSPSDLTSVNGVLYFTADDGAHGKELWRSDGTAVGTVMVKDIRAGAGSSCSDYTSHLTNVNGVLYFTADDGTNGEELWRSDGTAAGTVMVKDIRAGAKGSSPSDLTNVNGVLFFTADDGAHGKELWRSDGTAVGTVMVKDIQAGADGSSLRNLTNVNGVLYFRADNGTNGSELWRSDGTKAGTVMVKDIAAGKKSSSPSSLTNVNGVLYFRADDGTNGSELWRSDGTAAGTVVVKDIRASADGSLSHYPVLANMDGVLYFTADDGTNGSELWRSDGTAAGTVMVKDIRPGAGSSCSADTSNLTNVNGVLYFTADDGTNGEELWRSDGTAAGTVMVKDIRTGADGSSPSSLTNVDGVLYFTADDGFTASDGRNSRELWRSDGTEAGTVMVKDIRAGGRSSSPSSLTNVNGVLYFTVDDGTNGEELWRSDGTAAGTVMVKDIRTGARGALSNNSYSLTNVNGVLYFIADDGTNGDELWRSDGTAAGTVMVKDIRAGAKGSSLSYQRDGYGTVRVVRDPLINVNGVLYFRADDGTNGRELWRSDGTAAGTVMVKDIRPGADGSPLSSLTNVNGVLYFTVENGTNGKLRPARRINLPDTELPEPPALPVVVEEKSSRELWRSDGTAMGTVLVKDIAAVREGASDYSYPSDLTNVNGTLYFTTDNGTNGLELWRSDGTAAGTVIVKDIAAGTRDSYPSDLTNVNGVLFFTANDGTNGRGLWRSDGTAAGTVMVKDIQAGKKNSSPYSLINVNGVLYFIVSDRTNGMELWRSDGTAAGTVMVKDIYPGASNWLFLPCWPSLINVNGVLYFKADNGTNGEELWAYAPGSAVTPSASAKAPPQRR